MKKIICDYCGNEIKEFFEDYRGDLDGKNLAAIKIKPLWLNQTTHTIDHPDLCKECIIKVLKG